MASKLTGVAEMQQKIKDLDQKFLRKLFSTVMRDAAKVIRYYLISVAPDRDGTTRNSIKIRAGKRKKGHVTMLVTMAQESFPGKFYVGFVNWGTKLMKGTEWADRGFKAKEAEAEQLIKDGLAEIFNEAGTSGTGGSNK